MKTIGLLGLLFSLELLNFTANTAGAPASVATRDDERFAYTVIASHAKHLVDGIATIDTLLLTLMGAQAAVFALMIDKLATYRLPAVTALVVAFTLAALATIPTILVRRDLDVLDFLEQMAANPISAEEALIEDLVDSIEFNGRLKAIKSVLFTASIALTLIVILAALIERTIQSGG